MIGRVRVRRSTALKAVSATQVIGVVTAGAWAVAAWWESVNGTPPCSWPLRVRGTATPTQIGLASTDVYIMIRFADRVVERTGMQTVIATGGHSNWRMVLG
jgi:hypothetical protein